MRLKKRILCLTLMTVYPLVYSSAQALTFSDAYQRLLEKNLSYQRAKLDYLADKSQVTQARARLLPTIDVTGAKGYIQENSLNLEEEQDEQEAVQAASQADAEEKDEPDLSLEERKRDELAIRFRQPIYNRNLSMQLKRAKSEAFESELRLRGILEQQLARLSEIYFGVLNAGRALHIAQRERDEVNRHQDLSQQRFEAGLNNKADVYESISRLKVAEADLLSAQKVFDDALHRLLNLLRLNKDEFDLPNININKVNIALELPDLFELIEEGLADNVEYKLQQQLVTSAKYALKADRAAMLPSLDLTASRSRTETEALEIGDELSTDDRRVMLELNIPLFRGFGNLGRAREAKYRYQAEQLELENTKANIEESIREGYTAVSNAYKRMLSLESAYQNSELVLDLRKDGYIEGLVSNLDLLNAYRDKHRSETSWQQSIFDYLDSMVKLHILLGQLDTEYVTHIDQYFSKPDL